MKNLINNKDWLYAKVKVKYTGDNKGEENLLDDFTGNISSLSNYFNSNIEDNSLPITLDTSNIFLHVAVDLSHYMDRIEIEVLEVLDFNKEDLELMIKLQNLKLTLPKIKKVAKLWNSAVITYKGSNFNTERPYTVSERSYTVDSSDKYFDDNMMGNGLFGTCIGDSDRCKLNNYDWEVEEVYITKLNDGVTYENLLESLV